MESAEKYLEELIAISYRLNSSWRIMTEPLFDDEYDEELLLSTLQYLNAPNVYEEYQEGKYDSYIEANKDIRMDQLISRLAPPLLEDVKDCTQGKYNEDLDKTHLSFVPLNNAMAYCSNKNHDGEQLDGSIICIHHGLYFCSYLITKAFIFENMTGELQPYNKDGTLDYARAIRMFLKPNKNDIKSLFLEGQNIPPSVMGEISAYHSSMSTMILQFVALHEFAHILNGDVENEKFYELHFASISKKDLSGDTIEVRDCWAAEFAADTFAMKSLCDRSNYYKSAWANFVTIYLFFKWFKAIEDLTNTTISPYHPPPQDRANNIILYMHERYGINQEAQEMMDATDHWTAKWLDNIRKANALNKSSD